MNTIDIFLNPFSLEQVDSSWQPIIKNALRKMNPAYLETLATTDWLPGKDAIFNAFSLPIHKVNYVLFGESPYPRKTSANGYAFYDAAVRELWSAKGLSTKVNRATSLRNFIKMLLLADELLIPTNTSQEAIAEIDKRKLIQTNDQLFHKLLEKGFLLLNASLVLQNQNPKKDAKEWQPFLKYIIEALIHAQKVRGDHSIRWLLFGRIASAILPFLQAVNPDQIITSEHPYNLTFVQHPIILQTFKPLHLLHL